MLAIADNDRVRVPIRFLRVTSLVILLGSIPRSAICQTLDYTPITPAGRVDWIVDGTIGLKSLLFVGPLAASWQTAWNQPGEWGQGWSGFGKRYLQREADVAISNTLEAGVGAAWGEEPRYVRMGHGRIGARVKWAIKTAFVTQRRDGQLHPAWGRYVGNTLNNVIENTWLPPSSRTVGNTVYRSASGFATRMGGNALEEFWPDVVKLIRRP